MKFCTKCGTPVDGEQFCTKCGTPVEGAAEQAPYGAEPYGAAPAGAAAGVAGGVNNITSQLNGFVEQVKTNPNLRFKLIAAAAALLLVIILLVACGGRSEKALIKDYINASLKADGKKMVSLLPDKMVDYVVKEEFDGDKKEFISYMDDVMKMAQAGLEAQGIDKKSSFSIRILDEEKVDKDDVKEMNDELKDEGVKVKIKEAKEIRVEITFKHDGDKKTIEESLTIVKVGGKWCLLGGM